MRRGCKAEAAQRRLQGAGGDGGAFWGEVPGGAVGGIWGSSDDDQQLEARAGEACGRAVCAWQQGTCGRGCAEGDRRSASEDRSATGRARFSCRAARHLPSAERRAMIAPEAGLSLNPQSTPVRDAARRLLFWPPPGVPKEPELL